jgi:putative ABC transport system permease protein
MLKTYFKIAWRQLKKNRLFGTVNIAGLAIGLTVSLLLFLYVRHETSFDKYHSQQKNIYRLVFNARMDENHEKWAGNPNIVGPTFRKEISEVRDMTRWIRHNFGQSANVLYGGKKFFEKNLYWADSSFTRIFDVPFVHGNAATALVRPNTIIINETLSKKYFGNENPIGKVLKLDNKLNCEVTGVFKDFPDNSTLDADLIGSFYSVEWMKTERWGNASFETFLLMPDKVDIKKTEASFASVIDKHVKKEDQWFSINLQPLSEVHLYSPDIKSYSSRPGDLKQVKILSLLALAIIIIACINYMNLATARSQNRFRETGISKTMGATSRLLIGRFYIETGLFVVLAVLVSVLLLFLAMPVFNSLTNLNLSIKNLLSPEILAAVGIVTVTITLLSGSYPAFYLSRFNPKNLFHQTFSKNNIAGKLRQGLVVVQFSASVILIIATFLFYRQLDYIQSKELGYQPDQVVAVTSTAAENVDQVNALVNESKNLANVSAVCRAQTFPGRSGSGRTVNKPGDDGHGMPLTTCRATNGIVSALGLKLLAGADLPADKQPTDSTVNVILNKKAVEYLGFTPQEAIGKLVDVDLGPRAYVTGVVDDFHSQNLYQPLEAYAFHNAATEGRTFVLVKFTGGNVKTNIDKLEAIYKKSVPNGAFEFTFLDQFLQTLYVADLRTAKIVLIFSALAIFIACLGLFGLAAFIAEQKTKEIGIRKVLGASIGSIVLLLSGNFIRLVLLAVIIAIPVGWWLMNNWLQDFAYRISIGWTVFVLAGLTVITIALLTVSFQAIKAAMTNPVKALRTE